MHPSENEHHEDTGALVEMPRYKSHKTVWALEIDSIANEVDAASAKILTFRDKGYPKMRAPLEMFARYIPVPGDFYVQYEDGYKSFSPRKAFLEGYTRDLPDEERLGTKAVREAIERGKK